MERKVAELREFVNNCTEAELVVFRNYMTKAFPELASPGGQAPQEVVGTSLPPPPPPPQPSPVPRSQVPAQVILEDIQEGDVNMSASDIKNHIHGVVPFSNDLEIWGLTRIKDVDKYLVGYLDLNIPGDLQPSTDNDKYVTFLMKTLFEDRYRSEHAIPKDNLEVSTSYPYVPKAIIQFMHRVGRAAVVLNAAFDLEKYWKDIRRFFRDSEILPMDAEMPSLPASQLLERARGVVAQEKQTILMQRYMTRSGYESYVKELEDLKGIDDVALLPAGQGNLESSMNTTNINLRSRTVTASKSTDITAVGLDGKQARRRQHEEISQTDTEKKESATKKAKK